MKYEYISDGTSVIFGAFALSNIYEILSIIILILSILNILVNASIRIYHHLKNKEYKDISYEIDDVKNQLENIKNKERENNGK